MDTNGRIGQVRPWRLLGALCLLAALLTGPSGVGPATAAPFPRPCRAADLDAAVSHGGVTDHLWLRVGLTTVDPLMTCALTGPLDFQIQDATGRLLIAATAPDPGPVLLDPGSGVGVVADWGNWCAPDGIPGKHATVAGPLTVALRLPNDDAPVRGHPAGTVAEEGPLGGGPLCLDPAAGSWLRADPPRVAPGATVGPPGGTPIYVGARFLAYWRTHGGLAVNGYPLSPAFDQRLEDGKVYRVQYFERVRLEAHPENPPPGDVLLGQFGRRAHPADPPAAPLPDADYFDATGHTLRAGFRDYWRANGGLPQFGYPLTEEFTERLEDGNAYTVQYFERARFEWHPENPAPYRVLLGQFGRRFLAEAQAAPPAIAPCKAGELAGTAKWQGATGALRGTVFLGYRGADACAIAGVPGLAVLDGGGAPLPVLASASDAAAGARLVLTPGRTIAAAFVWRNWCGPAPLGPPALRVTLPGDDGRLTVPVVGAGDGPFVTPRCDAPGAPSTLTVEPFVAVDGP